ncbi:murein hydrolase activator EnvC family protein [Kineococcus sp. SYSU DK003]|uniref:murein hydrolase activator EnvC family protein n=1 Tax=Kineococcus sp. SYSU DK003 TaxID=3383124 RepID=UPI003D7D44C1
MLSSALPASVAGSVIGVATVAVAAAVVTAAPGPAPATVSAASSSWVWPVEPPHVLRGFDDVGRYEAGHRGVDLAAAPGQQVVAAAAGTVTFAGPVAGRGVVVVAHPNGLRTTYEPVEASVPAGTTVTAGQQLGALAADPVHCTAWCLHLGLRDGDVYLDPLTQLRASPPVLLPLGRA